MPVISYEEMENDLERQLEDLRRQIDELKSQGATESNIAIIHGLSTNTAVARIFD
jgi:hypothetical protein